MNSNNNPKYDIVNTFSRTPSPAQIAAYIIIAFETIVFFVMIRPSMAALSPNSALIFTILYSISLLAVIVSTFVCSFTDPSDPVMVCYKNNRHLPSPQLQKKLPRKLQQLLYCQYCMSYVQDTARHCRTCDRCVQNFDHHCMWINNCIGSRNYKIFLLMIISTFVNLVIFIISVIFLTVAFKRQEGSDEQKTILLGYMVTSWVVFAITTILSILLFNLILLHIYLICKGYTTYQFIIARRQEEKKQQLQKANEQLAKRQKAIRQKYQKLANKNKVGDSKFQNKKQQSPKKELPKRQYMIADETKIMKSQHQQEEYSYSNTNTIGRRILETPPENMKNRESQQMDSDDTLAKIKMQQHSKKNIKNFQDIGNQQSESGNDVIFGAKDMTESRSEVGSFKIGDKYEDGNKNNGDNQSKDRQHTYNDSINGNANQMIRQDIQRVQTHSQMEQQQEEKSVKISQFFTRNKSLSFLLSDSHAHKPKKMSHVSMLVEGNGETESVDDPRNHMPRTGKSQSKFSIGQSLPIDRITSKNKTKSNNRESGDSFNSKKNLKRK